MNTFQITINTLNLDYVNERLEKFNNKAKKLNCKQLDVNFSESYLDLSNEEDIKELIDITITQHEELIIADYKILAKVDHTYPGKNFIKEYDKDLTQDQINNWESIGSNCEHCNSNRKRNITFMLQNIQSNNIIQVGKTCLNDFLGHDIQKNLNYFDLLEELQFDIINHLSDKKIDFYKVNDILSIINNLIKKDGYESNKAKYEGKIMLTTGDKVKLIINDIMGNIDDNKRKLTKSTHEEDASFNMIKDYILNYNIDNEIDTLKDFYRSLKNVLKHEYCKFNDISILSTIFVTYDILKKKEFKEEEKGISQYVGKEKDKIEIELTFIKLFGYDTQYGRMYISIYADQKGNIYKWNSKSILDIEKEEYKRVKATIKGHEEYKGEKQTIITRCKVIE